MPADGLSDGEPGGTRSAVVVRQRMASPIGGFMVVAAVVAVL